VTDEKLLAAGVEADRLGEASEEAFAQFGLVRSSLS